MTRVQYRWLPRIAGTILGAGLAGTVAHAANSQLQPPASVTVINHALSDQSRYRVAIEKRQNTTGQPNIGTSAKGVVKQAPQYDGGSPPTAPKTEPKKDTQPCAHPPNQPC